MINRVGYACINEHLKPKTFKSCRLKTIKGKGITHLKDIILHNLDFTYEILNWNLNHEILLYRVTSDLMPLVTHQDVLAMDEWRWYEDEEIAIKLKVIKTLVQENNIRLSMHPDQFTVLNSNKSKVIEASLEYLEYHARLLHAIGGQDIIIHVGGVYGEKVAAMERFVEQYNLLSPKIRKLLRLENDDKSYSIFDVLEISEGTGVPIVFDYHHHRCLTDGVVTIDLIKRIERTWKSAVPKMHISSGKSSVKDRSHNEYISSEDCQAVVAFYQDCQVDVMIEAKMKDRAALRFLAEVERIRKVKTNKE